MRIVAADHHPVGADAFGDVGQCGIVRAEREIEIVETFFGTAPRLLPCGRAGVVGCFETIHQPRNKPDADFEKAPAKFWKAIDHAAKNQRRDCRENFEWKTKTDVQVESRVALNAQQRSAVYTVNQNGNTESFDAFVKRPEKLAIKVLAVDVLIDDNGVETEFLDCIFGLGDRQVDVLQRRGGDADKFIRITSQNSCDRPIKRSTDTGTHGAVDVIIKRSVIGNQHLHIKSILGHGIDPGAGSRSKAEWPFSRSGLICGGTKGSLA